MHTMTSFECCSYEGTYIHTQYRLVPMGSTLFERSVKQTTKPQIKYVCKTYMDNCYLSYKWDKDLWFSSSVQLLSTQTCKNRHC